MAVICNTCGLPDDLCACGDLDKDSTHIIIRLETRRFRMFLQGDHRDTIKDTLVKLGFAEETIELH